MNRRGLITGLISFVAAPAIIRVAPVMKISPIKHVVIDLGMRDYIGWMLLINGDYYKIIETTDYINFEKVDRLLA